MNELFERELRNISINDVSLADYVKENYVPMLVIEDIKAEIEEKISRNYGSLVECGMEMALETIDKHIGAEMEGEE